MYAFPYNAGGLTAGKDRSGNKKYIWNFSSCGYTNVGNFANRCVHLCFQMDSMLFSLLTKANVAQD